MNHIHKLSLKWSVEISEKKSFWEFLVYVVIFEILLEWYLGFEG